MAADDAAYDIALDTESELDASKIAVTFMADLEKGFDQD